MVGCLVALGLVFAVGSSAPVGMAFHYERVGALARVAAIRHMPVAWDHIDGLASLPDCRYVVPTRPWFVRARFWRGAGWGPWEVYQVTDCSDPRHLPMQRARGLVIEIDYRAAQRNHFAWNGRSGKGKTRAQVGARWQIDLSK